MKLLEKLVGRTPLLQINLMLDHGVLARHARWHARVVAYSALPGTAARAPNLDGDPDNDAAFPAQPRHQAWRIPCAGPSTSTCSPARCEGRLRLLGIIENPVAIRAILDRLAASAERPDCPLPATTFEPAPVATQA